MLPHNLTNPSTVLDQVHVSNLEIQVNAAVQDKRRRSRLLERLLARDGLISILEEYEEQHGLTFDINVTGGFASEHWRRELLGIVDMTVNGWLVAAHPVDPVSGRLWLSAAQLKARCAPDLCAAIAISADSGDGGARVTLRGWATPQEIIGQASVDEGLYRIEVARLQPPESFFLHIQQTSGALRQTAARPLSSAERAGLQRAILAPANIRPLSLVAPDIFDYLAADQQLAELYVRALALPSVPRVFVGKAGVAPLRAPNVAPAIAMDIAAIGQGALAVAPNQAEAQAGNRLIAQIIELIQASKLQKAIDLLNDNLKDTTDPNLLNLGAIVHGLVGNPKDAVDLSKKAYQANPEKAFGLFSPASKLMSRLDRLITPFLGAPYQRPALAALAEQHLEVIDAADPGKTFEYTDSGARLRLKNWPVIFSLGVKLPQAYANYRYRVFVLTDELRFWADLKEREALRQAFALKPDGRPTELEHILVVQGSVLTEKGRLLEGIVREDGIINIWEPIKTIERPSEDFLNNKTVVVALYSLER